MVTLIYRLIYEIVFFLFEFSLIPAYTRGQKVQEAGLTKLSTASMKEYVRCSSSPVPSFECLVHCWI